jgi:hypothetical protein
VSETARISVVIPTYNCAQWIGQALDSVLAQTMAPAEVIVVDDGSKDDTPGVMERYVARGVQYIRQPNSGVAAARNRGIAQSSGELIAFLDADDTWHPRKLEIQVPVLASRPELGLLATALFDPVETTDPGQIPESRDVAIIAWRKLVVKNYLATSSILARRAAIDSAGEVPFDTALQGPEDHDLWIRIAEVAKVGKLDLALTGYRSVPGSLSKQAQKMEAGMTRILQKVESREAWKVHGSGPLRRHARAYVHFSSAYLYGAAGMQWQAMGKVLRSLGIFPMPFDPLEVKKPFARPRLLGMALLRQVGLRRPE